MGDELVGDPAQGNLGDVHLVPADQLEQQVEGALEVVEGHLEPLVGAVVGRQLWLDEVLGGLR